MAFDTEIDADGKKRRQILAAIGATGILLPFSTSTTSASSREWEDTGKDSDELDNRRIEHGYCMAYHGSYTDNDGRPIHDIRVNNCGVSRWYDGSEWHATDHVSSFSNHQIEIDANYLSNVLLDGDDSSVLGAAPPAWGGYSDLGATYDVVETAVGLISTPLELGLTASQIAEDLTSDSKTEEKSENQRLYDWTYDTNGEPHEMSNHYEFLIRMDNKCDYTYFDLRARTSNYSVGGTFIEKTYSISNTDCGGIQSTSTSTTDGQNWTKVPKSKIRENPRLQRIEKELGNGPLRKAYLPIEVVEERTGKEFDPQN